MTKEKMVEVIKDDGYAITFQSLKQYREALIKLFSSGEPMSKNEQEILGMREEIGQILLRILNRDFGEEYDNCNCSRRCEEIKEGELNQATDKIMELMGEKEPRKPMSKKDIESLLWKRFPDLQELIKPIATAIHSVIKGEGK